MRILFCTKKDVFGAWILNWILPKLIGHQVRVLLSDKTRPAEHSVPALLEEKFLERDLPLQGLFPLIDAQSTQGPLATFEGCAKRYQLEINTVTSINDPATEQQIREWSPDIIISARFSLIFKSNIERIPRLGIFNIHPGTLPGYAGLYAPLRGIFNGEEKLGCTLHRVDEGIDTGAIYSVSHLKVIPERSIFGHIAPLYELGLLSVLHLLEELEQGNVVKLEAQDTNLFRYYRLPEQEVFTELERRGIQVVSYSVYSEFIRQFVAPEGMGQPTGPLEATALERLVHSVKTSGVEASLRSFKDSFASVGASN
jgi:methionyl-tRNA formyltransferase